MLSSCHPKDPKILQRRSSRWLPKRGPRLQPAEHLRDWILRPAMRMRGRHLLAENRSHEVAIGRLAFAAPEHMAEYIQTYRCGTGQPERKSHFSGRPRGQINWDRLLPMFHESVPVYSSPEKHQACSKVFSKNFDTTELRTCRLQERSTLILDGSLRVTLWSGHPITTWEWHRDGCLAQLLPFETLPDHPGAEHRQEESPT